jgi:hypothetical protein
MSTVKEPHFFSRSDRWQLGWERYHDLWRPANAGARQFGEASTSYTCSDHEDAAIARIAEHLPDIRLIYIVRHPLRRIESAYREDHTNGFRRRCYLPFDLADALAAESRILADTHYWTRLEKWRAHYADAAIHVVLLEDLQADQDACLRGCFRFLGVDDTVALPAAPVRSNPADRKTYDTALLRAVHRTPVLSGLYRRLPDRLHRHLRKVVCRPFCEPIEWAPELEKRVLAELRPDMMAILQHARRDPSVWAL